MTEIVHYPDAILKKPTQPVKKIDDAFRLRLEEMRLFFGRNRGIGLAANQIGWDARVCIIRENPKSEQILINPEIVWSSKKEAFMSEGCLSFPGLTIPVERPTSIDVVAQDPDGGERIFRAHWLAARIVQHEVDHLNGITFLDRLSFANSLVGAEKIKSYLDWARQRATERATT